jgi:PII-like signaling protein
MLSNLFYPIVLAVIDEPKSVHRQFKQADEVRMVGSIISIKQTKMLEILHQLPWHVSAQQAK